ncbi:zinc finger MYM-type protein 1-like [Montipora capricornis]|uniref:zinc finger MYM-type protein 1-like n=1 Tax=Montipora capricornis TaxID=246305 RepID=UPI0035F16220
MDAQKSFYSKVYQRQQTNQKSAEAKRFLDNPSIAKLSDEQRTSCEGKIAIEECEKILGSFQTDSPYQPKNFKFPAKTFGSKNQTKRSFQTAWFERFKWLHYDERRDAAYCHTCLKALHSGMLTSSIADPAFTKNGFCNWKNSLEKKKGFQKHESSDSHMEAVARYVKAPATVIGDIGDLLCERHALARQALPLRGDWNTETMCEENSNFHQLLKLRSQENPEIIEWLQKRDEKYTSPEIQNEMLEAMAFGMMRKISANIQNATFFTIMADETADVSNKEQLVICIRWVDHWFCDTRRFHRNASFGKNNCRSIQCISDSLDTVREIGKLVKKSPQRNTKLDKIRAETKNESRGVHAFCLTRWTVRGEALAAVINNHAELMELWDWLLTVSKDSEMKARIRGVQSMMTTFIFYFGCTLGEQLLRQTDNLGRALQDSSTSAAQGNRLAQDVVKTLLKDRTGTSFNLFWARILQRKTTEIQTIEDPKLPRKRKAPVRHEVGEQNTHHFPETHKDHYRRIYFKAIDTVTQCMATRFEQKDFKIYLNIQELLLKSFASEPCDTELAEVVKMYSEYLDSFKLTG